MVRAESKLVAIKRRSSRISSFCSSRKSLKIQSEPWEGPKREWWSIVLTLSWTTPLMTHHILTQLSPSTVNEVSDNGDENSMSALPFAYFNLWIAVLV